MSKSEGATQNTARGAGQLLMDLGPIIAFVLTFNVAKRLGADHPVHQALGTTPDQSLFIATGVFIAATLLAVIASYVRTRKVPPVLIVTAVLVVGFGGLTLALHDEGFIKIKPTIVNLFYAVAIFGSMAAGHNVWKLLFRHAFTLPDQIWRTLAIRWGVFFVFMAGLNEVIWRNFSTDFWVDSRLWLTFPLVFLFAMANVPITMKYAGRETMDAPAAAPTPPTTAS